MLSPAPTAYSVASDQEYLLPDANFAQTASSPPRTPPRSNPVDSPFFAQTKVPFTLDSPERLSLVSSFVQRTDVGSIVINARLPGYRPPEPKSPTARLPASRSSISELSSFSSRLSIFDPFMPSTPQASKPPDINSSTRNEIPVPRVSQGPPRPPTPDSALPLFLCGPIADSSVLAFALTGDVDAVIPAVMDRRMDAWLPGCILRKVSNKDKAPVLECVPDCGSEPSTRSVRGYTFYPSTDADRSSLQDLMRNLNKGAKRERVVVGEVKGLGTGRATRKHAWAWAFEPCKEFRGEEWTDEMQFAEGQALWEILRHVRKLSREERFELLCNLLAPPGLLRARQQHDLRGVVFRYLKSSLDD